MIFTNQQIIARFNALCVDGASFQKVTNQILREFNLTYKRFRAIFFLEAEIDIGPRKRFYKGGVNMQRVKDYQQERN